MKRHSILTILWFASSTLATLSALVVAFFMLRRWIFLWATWSAGVQTSEAHETSDILQTNWPTVLLLAPFRNEAQTLPGLLAHLNELAYPNEQLTIVLIDDGSIDESPRIAQIWVNDQPNRYLLTLPRNVGKASALNAALGHFPQGELVAVYDADERPSPSALSYLVAYFTNSQVATVNGRRAVSNPLTSIFASYSAIESLVHQLVTMQAKERLALAPAILGSNCVYRRQALVDVGCFLCDALLEDSDLTVKLVRAGWQTRFCSHAISIHAVPQTLNGHWRQHARWSQGFGIVARQQTRQIMTTPKLSWQMRLELLAFASGYVDRAAWLVISLWVVAKTAVTRRPPFIFLTILATSLITPLFQAVAALRHAQAPSALYWRVLLLPLLLPLDVASSLNGILQRVAYWEEREQQHKRGTE
jgi:cellulose synthase/poly-beta-1,6-N-acetylglucosamine synthase-like glycosyltransferase